MNPIKAIVSACGLKAKPVSPHEKIIIDNNVKHYSAEWVVFDSEYPELFLTSPQVPCSEIMVDAEPIWQYISRRYNPLEINKPTNTV